MARHPSEHCVVHPLPRAPQFVGRDAELTALQDLWRNGTRGVVALVGLGGAGKTAIACAFLEELDEGQSRSPRPKGLFVWSFYQEPDAGYFLQELHRYFTHTDHLPTPAKGLRLLHLLARRACTRADHTCWCSTGWSACSAGEDTLREFRTDRRSVAQGSLDSGRRGRRTNGRSGHEPISAGRSPFVSRRRLPPYRHRAV